MEIERVTHYVDNVLTQAEARMGLRNTKLLVAWYTNQKNDQSVVHSHPYHELVLPIGGSTVRYSIDGSVYLVHVGELIYFPAQIYHAGIFNIDNDHSDRLVIQIDDALWQACRRNANLKNAAWMHSITVLDPDVCNKWDFQSLFVRMAQSQELPAQMRDIVFEAQVSEMMLLITLATGSGQTTAPSSTNVLVQRAVSYLQAHYQDPTLTTVKLAQELYASREHLSRAFKECTMEKHPQLPDPSADAALPQSTGRWCLRSQRLHRERLPGLQQFPQNVPAAVWHHTRGVPLPEPEKSLITERIKRSKSSIMDLKSSHLCGMANAKRGRSLSFSEKRKRPRFVYFFRYSRGVMPKCALNARLK